MPAPMLAPIAGVELNTPDSSPAPDVVAAALAEEVAAARGPEADEVTEVTDEQAVADALDATVLD